MTLVAGEAAHQGKGKTHVLIIGVGKYRHLHGGTQPIAGLSALGQLTSPPVSARALANWFISGRPENPKAPLGSVEMVLSEDPVAGPVNGFAVDAATYDNINQAFAAWFKRCDAHADNVGFFYFCGHGLQKEVMMLLPEDYGSGLNPNATGIDFDRTYRGMARCCARTQVYVVDACRQTPPSIVLDQTFGGNALISSILTLNKPRTAPRIFATAEGMAAFGDSGTVSRMTDALIKCLDGLGSDKQNGRWRVDTDHLGGAIQKLLDYRARAMGDLDPQRVDPSGGDGAEGNQILHVLPRNTAPNVIVSFACSEPHDVTLASFWHVARRGGRMPVPPATPLEIVLQAGTYDFGCLLGNGECHSLSEEAIRPPVWPITLP